MSFSARERLDRLEGENLLRNVRSLVPVDGVRVRVEGRLVHLFSSNDYLGLSSCEAVRTAVSTSVLEVGMGPRGAALICGYTEAHEQLEHSLAVLKETEASLLFPTGFQANLGVLSALGSEDTTFFSDALNHASIIDGCRLARGKVEVYRHRDMNHLESLLQRSDSKLKVLVTDALFSMDGTLAPLRDLVQLRARYGALLVVDEAHSTLVYGAKGGGVAQEMGVSQEIDFHVGTLSKAVGAHGGFVATSTDRRRWLMNVARSFVFTTALPQPIVVAAQAALKSWSRARVDLLWERVKEVEDALGRPLESPIVSVVLGEEERTLTASRKLFESGFHVPAIRPPTVPMGTSRLRIALSALHDADVVADLMTQMETI